MTFYYTEPKAGNIWVFALDGGGTSRVSPGTNLTTMKGALPQVGEPGHLGGTRPPGYGFEPTEGGEPIQGAGPPQPTGSSAAASPSGAGEMANPFAGDPAALATGERLRAPGERCQGCHKAAGGSGPNIFRTRLSAKPFVDVVTEGRKGMPAFRGLLDQDAILRIHAFVRSRDQL
ncbi:MAG: cytochrome c [Bryobacterales bacterium]